MKVFAYKLNKIALELCITGLKHYGFIYNQKLADKDLKFIREPNNKFDKNAIKVLLDGKKIGYIYSEEAKQLAPIMDANPTLQPYQWGCVHKQSTDGYMVIHLKMKANKKIKDRNNILET